ncbi:MAG: alpha-galactosidase [Clostridia bacterium]|nr:alpha-galactosidase [Clostridia bacterium]
MKRNGMCPIYYLKKLFGLRESVTEIYDPTPYDNGVALTPPMGWSSWNTFKNRIDEDLIYDTARAMVDSGLKDAGYTYVNLDDNWHSSLRDADGNLQGDLTTFAHGIPALVKKINDLGLKVGIYSSNGTETCEDLPGTLYHEKQDALTFAKWGIEYFKYDYCHHIKISPYAPWVYGISVSKKGEKEADFYSVKDAKLFGYAKLWKDKVAPSGYRVTGLDGNSGAIEFNSVIAQEDGEYILTIDIRKKGRYAKCLMAKVNDGEVYMIDFPSQKHWNNTARFQVPVLLQKGENKIRLFNPIGNRADSAMLQYQNMGKQLRNATKKVAMDTNSPEKPIVFSLCEWGWNMPYKWGSTAGNLWRTTPDIRPDWLWMINYMYRHNVKLDKYASVGHWNDPDMLEVGNGNLTYDENVAHFSLWCMMASPLILGNDLRKITPEVLSIVTNKNLIAVNQDPLGIQCRRIKKGRVDTLLKPLADGSFALCFFNKAGGSRTATCSLKALEAYGLPFSTEYKVTDLWSNEEQNIADRLTVKLNRHSVKVYKIEA